MGATEAAGELGVLEAELRQKYASQSAPSKSYPTSDVSPWPRQTPSSGSDVLPWRSGADDATRTQSLRPAALDPDEVREIERYHVSFRHHFLGAREAGVEAGQTTQQISTWVIWPHLADSIVMAVVEAAIEEMSEAMDQ